MKKGADLFEWGFFLCLLTLSLPASDHLVVDPSGFAKIRNLFPFRKLFNNDLFKAFWPGNAGAGFKLRTNPDTELS